MSKERLFGTDGVRGVANVGLTAALALQLGRAAGYWVQRTVQTAGVVASISTYTRPTIIIGRDTRLSGDMLEAALAAGMASAGVDVVNVGVVPTPAVAQIVLARGASAGAVISASHNPFEDNGIKFFGPNGKKLPDRVEDEIAALIHILETLPIPTGGDIGRVIETRQPIADYMDRVAGTLASYGNTPLSGQKLVMDSANGAAYELAPQIFRDLGAHLTLLNADPDGVNINVECGSTHPHEMSSVVCATTANAGLAFDGDADRVMLADENGAIVDGDRMMAILALSLHAQGLLTGNVVVATIMSNVGLEQALERHPLRRRDSQGIRGSHS